MSSFEDKQKAFEDIMKTLIELLPSSYNKEVTDTNYYKLLRAFALQLADAKIEIEEIGKNRYLNDAVSAQSIYDNFGVLVKLQKNPDWDTEKYRDLIKGVMQSLLKGPSKESMIEGFKLFTKFKTNIYELYKDYDKIDSTAYQGYNPKYTFALEIEKPIDEYIDQDILLRDANYVINIIKPAHTLSINIITIIGDENYKRYYSIERKLGLLTEKCIERKVQQYLNNELSHRFDNEAEDYSKLNNISFEEAKAILRSISSSMTEEEYEEGIALLANSKYNQYLNSLKHCDLAMEKLEYFEIDARAESRGILEKKWLQELTDNVFKEAFIDFTKEQINDIVESKKNEIMILCDNDYECDVNELSDIEWYKKAEDIIKWETLKKYVLNILGGESKVRAECSEESEKFRQELEKLYIQNNPYCEMDEMLSEGSLGNSEGKYGWNHIGYDNQFITNINSKTCKIGGSRLLGPRYILNEFNISDIELDNIDHFFKPKEESLLSDLVFIEEDKIDVEDDLLDMFSEYAENNNSIEKIKENNENVLELSEKVRFLYQHDDFKFEHSKMPEEDLLVADKVEILNHIEVNGFEESFPPPIEGDSTMVMSTIINGVEVILDTRTV